MMLDQFAMKIKTKIVFGTGTIRDIATYAKELHGTNIMLVADKGVQKTGIVDRLLALLEDAHYSVILFDEIVPNPQSYDCERGARIALDQNIDLIIAAGGGSSMDTAKAIAAMAGHHTTRFEDVTWPNVYTHAPVPLICIPTTAGTGSEVTTCGVITNSSTHKKEYCFDDQCAPEIAIADPELLMTLPEKVAASTGVDALTHAIEGYVAKCANPITSAYGLYAIRLIIRNLRDYVFHRTIKNASAMMMGSLMAGIAFGYADTGCVHTLSETISKYYNTPHGLANAVFLAPVTRYSICGDIPHYAEVAQALGILDPSLTEEKLAYQTADVLEALIDDLEIPDFSEIPGVDPADFDAIAEDCMSHISVASNPRLFTRKDFKKMLDETYQIKRKSAQK